MSKEVGKVISRRKLFQGLAVAVGAVGLASFGVRQAEAGPRKAPVELVFRDPSEFSFTPLPQDIAGIQTGGEFRWGMMSVTALAAFGAENPVPLDSPTPDGKLLTGHVFGARVIQEGQLSVVRVEMPYNGKPIGIQHIDHTNPNGSMISGVEVDKDGQLVGLVKEGVGSAPQYIPLESVPEGTESVKFDMIFGDGGKLVGFHGLDGGLRKLVELPRPTVEPGAPSFIVAWTPANNPEGMVRAGLLAAPSAK